MVSARVVSLSVHMLSVAHAWHVLGCLQGYRNGDAGAPGAGLVDRRISAHAGSISVGSVQRSAFCVRTNVAVYTVPCIYPHVDSKSASALVLAVLSPVMLLLYSYSYIAASRQRWTLELVLDARPDALVHSASLFA